MSAFSGRGPDPDDPQSRWGKGAAKRLRAIKRLQAESRNAMTPVERTRKYRLANEATS